MEVLIDELSNLTGVPVQLVEPKPGSWVVVPKDRGLLRTKLWTVLRTGPGGGIGHSPVQAALLFVKAFGSAGPRKVAAKHRARTWISELLADGEPRTVDEVKALARASGITWSSADRAARELSVERMKCGFHGPWIWQLASITNADS